MAGGSNVRLVRCPNCDNLLPELLEYSVYQCVACATILRAKKRDPGSDVVSEKSDEEKRLSESSVEKRSDPLNPTLGTKEIEDSESESNWRRKDRAFTEKKANSGNMSFQRSEKKETSGISGEFKASKLEQSVKETGYESVESHGRFRDSKTDQERSMRTRPRMDWTAAERGNGLVPEWKIAPNFSYDDVGPSNYDPNSFHQGSNFPGGVEQLERERAELLRKLDELKEQLSRSYPVPPERPAVERESMPPRPYNVAAAQPPFVDRRSFYPPPPQYHYHPPHVPIVRRYGSFDPDPLRPYTHEDYFHSPACSCLTCYDQSLWVPRFQVAHPNPNANPNLYRHNDRVVLGPQQGYSSPWSHARWPGELEPEKRAVAASKKTGRYCLPIAGGAPFIACQNCFESLELPRGKLRLTNNHRQRLRCGGCSAVISLQLENNRKLVVSDADDDVKGSPKISNDGNVVVRSGSLNANCASSCSEEFNKNSSFNFRSAVTDRSSLEEEAERLSLDESESKKKSKKVYSSSSSVSYSREELSFSPGIAREVDAHETAEFPVPPRSPMWQEPGSPRRATNTDEVFDRVNYKEAEATELDVSFNEYQHMSQDFPESSREDYPSRANGGRKGDSDSFLVGFIKKSLRDFSKSSHGSVESEKPKVFVNGKPLRDRLVRSAEMYAGPIRPGDYWYDYKAGFWGVMGQPCLGIIPRGIEEFNYPMPTNCGAGDTGVYVNGRELNERDLDLLASRGLPTDRDRFYVVEINGKVFNEGTGEFIHNLGKLAPTVERTKQGFGMKVPRSVQ